MTRPNKVKGVKKQAGDEVFLAVLGGNLMACPAINRLRERGHRVLVVDGNPSSPARKVADVFVHQDFSMADSTRKKLSNVPLSGVMPLNDFAIAAASQLARERGLPGWNEFAETCVRSKVAMKRAWVAAGLPTAEYVATTVENLLSGQFPRWDTWPCVVKPSFSGGGEPWRIRRLKLERGPRAVGLRKGKVS